MEQAPEEREEREKEMKKTPETSIPRFYISLMLLFLFYFPGKHELIDLLGFTQLSVEAFNGLEIDWSN